MTEHTREAYVTGGVFDKEDMRPHIAGCITFDGCIFRNCDFSSSQLDGIKFLNCSFTACLFTLTSFAGTLLDDVVFSDCKMTGAAFGDRSGSHRLSASFAGCILDNALFCSVKAPKTAFRKCRMHETVVERCDFRESIFDACDMAGIAFTASDLAGTDFTTSYGWTIDPEDNKIRGARFSLPTLPGLLTKYRIKVES